MDVLCFSIHACPDTFFTVSFIHLSFCFYFSCLLLYFSVKSSGSKLAIQKKVKGSSHRGGKSDDGDEDSDAADDVVPAEPENETDETDRTTETSRKQRRKGKKARAHKHQEEPAEHVEEEEEEEEGEVQSKKHPQEVGFGMIMLCSVLFFLR